MMHIDIRSEEAGDEDAIDMVVCRAFQEMNEANLVRLYRESYPRFNRKYSVTAWDGSKLVGYALYLPLEMRLDGNWVDAVALSPDAVVPEWQNQGIGGELVRYGLEQAKADGFAVAVTGGAPAFYTKLGYEPSMHAAAHVFIDTNALPEPKHELSAWPVTSSDLPWLVRCHDAECRDVDFSWRRGKDMREWAAPFVDTVIWRTADGRRAAYTSRAPEETYFSMLLGDDPTLVRDVIATVRPTVLAQHPSGWLAKNVLDSAWASTEAKASADLLACALQPGALDEYRAAVGKGVRLPGSLTWPLQLVVCG